MKQEEGGDGVKKELQEKIQEVIDLKVGIQSQ